MRGPNGGRDDQQPKALAAFVRSQVPIIVRNRHALHLTKGNPAITATVMTTVMAAKCQ